jgi:hypothetical protein
MKKVLIIILIVFIVLIIGARIYLPYLIRDQINDQIAAIEGYSGQVERVSLEILKGGIVLRNFNLYEEASHDPSIPFVSLRHNEINLDWSSLIRKGIVTLEIYMDSLEVNFVLRDEEKVVEEVDRENLADQLSALIPFHINVLRIENSFISYVDPTTDPKVDIYLADFFLEATNLRNIEKENDTLPATVHVEGITMGKGFMIANARLNAMKEIPDFEFDFKLENFDIDQLNDFTDAYAGFTVNEGQLNIYAEAAAFEGAITGYVKPLIEDMEVAPTEDDDASLLQEAYEAVLDVVARILQNPDTENIGTRVEFEGRIDEPEVAVMDAVWILLRNAFLESISKGIEGVVDIEDLMN